MIRLCRGCRLEETRNEVCVANVVRIRKNLGTYTCEEATNIAAFHPRNQHEKTHVLVNVSMSILLESWFEACVQDPRTIYHRNDLIKIGTTPCTRIGTSLISSRKQIMKRLLMIFVLRYLHTCPLPKTYGSLIFGGISEAETAPS